MEFKDLVKMNLKNLQQLKEKSSGKDLETINKVMETVKEKYRKKNHSTKEKSGTSVSSNSSNENSKVWTAPHEEECRKTTLVNAVNLMKNYKKREKKINKRPDPIEKTIHQDETIKMIEQHLAKNKPNTIVNEVRKISLEQTADTRFEFLKDYDILSITFQVIHK